jgi:hypothetical protein
VGMSAKTITSTNVSLWDTHALFWARITAHWTWFKLQKYHPPLGTTSWSSQIYVYTLTIFIQPMEIGWCSISYQLNNEIVEELITTYLNLPKCAYKIFSWQDDFGRCNIPPVFIIFLYIKD